MEAKAYEIIARITTLKRAYNEKLARYKAADEESKRLSDELDTDHRFIQRLWNDLHEAVEEVKTSGKAEG